MLGRQEPALLERQRHGLIDVNSVGKGKGDAAEWHCRKCHLGLRRGAHQELSASDFRGLVSQS